jgi:hypothetical protein
VKILNVTIFSLYSTQSPILDLPSEVLEKIFLQLNAKDLKAITETCKTFNEFVGSSTSLMQSFDVVWKKDTHEDPDIYLLTESRRRYQKIDIFDAEGIHSNLTTFIKTHLSSLAGIRFYSGSFKMSELIMMLEVTAPNLEHFKLSCTNFQDDVEEVHAIRFPKLLKLEIYNYDLNNEQWESLYSLFNLAQNIEVSL